MAYVTSKEVETFVGIAYTDFKVNGETMTEGQWQDFVEVYQVPIADMVHRYCRVPTFDPTSSQGLVTEIRNGHACTDQDSPYVRGSTNSSYTSTSGDYYPYDYEYYLANLYFTGTVNGVTYAPVVVEEDTADKTATPTWYTRTIRSNTAGGDYEVITRDELTSVNFHNNTPKSGRNNLKFTYYTGYDPSSAQFKNVKLQILRCFKNFLMLKKKMQEPLTIRAHGVRDFQTMFEPFDESHILSDLEMVALEPYRRIPIPGDMYE